MAFQNASAGMANFLGNIGNMRRTWEQEELQRQQEERTKEKFARDMEKSALDIQFAKSQEGREAAAEAHRQKLRPGEVTNQDLTIQGNRTRVDQGNWQFDREKTQAPILDERAKQLFDLEVKIKNSGLSANQQAAALNRIRQQREQMGLDRDTLVNQDLYGMWNKPASSEPGAPTIGETVVLGGIDKTPWGTDRTMWTREHDQLLSQMHNARVNPSAAQINRLNELRAKMKLAPLSPDSFNRTAIPTGGYSTYMQGGAGGQAPGAGSGMTAEELLALERALGG